MTNHPQLPDGAFITKSASDLPVITCTSRSSSYQLLLQGAQLLSWAPSHHFDVVWLSPHAQIIPGKSPRGGTPICWPWFGPASSSNLPAHGLVRAQAWIFEGYSRDTSDTDTLHFSTSTSPATTPDWPHCATLNLTYRIGPTLGITLETLNTGESPFSITEAIHTYIGVNDARSIEIRGLENSTYLDRLQEDNRFVQQGAISISGETDRIYVSNSQPCNIVDPEAKRIIQITTEGSQSRVVWNPWIEKGLKLGDLGTDDYLRMVCVECGNVSDNAVVVEPGNTHRMHIEYSVLPL